ncbi:Hypothetical protein ETEE_2695 [Edwardsiella anguillarum ET080813]|uniref:Uncharacterized protein n=1 Tax=Edwardsiella anguillarum ET080813 TaxID=667120 RepID=A0A076LRF1_9GAMM|nr:Hypothetical protein ETEE_2695 [Edwardsiella anguillarum ET080813]
MALKCNGSTLFQTYRIIKTYLLYGGYNFLILLEAIVGE